LKDGGELKPSIRTNALLVSFKFASNVCCCAPKASNWIDRRVLHFVAHMSVRIHCGTTQREESRQILPNQFQGLGEHVGVTVLWQSLEARFPLLSDVRFVSL
jgi:hypothetical protein